MKRHALAGIFLSLVIFLGNSNLVLAQSKMIAIGAGPVVGTFYVVLSAYGKLMKDKLGWNPNVEVTGGPTNNVQLTHAGELEFGLSTMAPIHEGYHGTGWTNGTKYDNIRTVLGTFSSRFQFYTFKANNITKASDLAGKRLSTGSTGSTPHLFSKRVFEVLGGAPSAYIAGNYGDLNNQLRDGLVDSGFTVSGIPHPAVTELSVRRPTVVFSLDASERKKIQKVYPYLTDCVMPANTYKGQDSDLTTICLWNAIITHKDVPDQLVYDFVKTTFENLPTLIAAHKSGRETKPENVAVIATPLHRAAARYYTELGLKIPDVAKPID